MENPCIECGGNCCWHEDCKCHNIIFMSVIEDIKAEIGNNVEWHFKNHQEDIAQIYSDALNIIDKHIADMRGAE